MAGSGIFNWSGQHIDEAPSEGQYEAQFPSKFGRLRGGDAPSRNALERHEIKQRACRVFNLLSNRELKKCGWEKFRASWTT